MLRQDWRKAAAGSNLTPVSERDLSMPAGAATADCGCPLACSLHVLKYWPQGHDWHCRPAAAAAASASASVGQQRALWRPGWQPACSCLQVAAVTAAAPSHPQHCCRAALGGAALLVPAFSEKGCKARGSTAATRAGKQVQRDPAPAPGKCPDHHALPYRPETPTHLATATPKPTVRFLCRGKQLPSQTAQPCSLDKKRTTVLKAGSVGPASPRMRQHEATDPEAGPLESDRLRDEEPATPRQKLARAASNTSKEVGFAGTLLTVRSAAQCA